MKSLLTRSLAFVAIAAVPASAQAQQASNWTGFYVGANAGYAWGDSDVSTSTECPANGYYCSPGNGLGNLAAINADGSGSLDPNAFNGGGLIGGNWQSGNLVFGLEADFGALDLSAATTASRRYPNAAIFTYTIRTAMETDWLFTGRARVGLAVNDVLVYATGGVAVTNLEVSNSFRDNNGGGAREEASSTETKTGWTVGGGLEWALTRNWSLKGEYLYVDFGSVTASGTVENPASPGLTNPLSTSGDLTTHIGRAGINFRF